MRSRDDKLRSIMSANIWFHVSLNVAYRTWNGTLYRRESGLASLAGYRIQRTPADSLLADEWLEDIT